MRFDDALSHPSTGALIQKALLTAATTDVAERHRLLASLITKRLTSGADDTVTLAGSVAVDVVGAFSPRHIRMLGVMVVLYALRPTETPSPKNQAEYDDLLFSWLEEDLGPLLADDLRTAKGSDFDHLLAVSCITQWEPRVIGRHTPPPQVPLLIAELVGRVIPRPDGAQIQLQPTASRLEASSWWPILTHLWVSEMDRSRLTTIGGLIGTLYHNEITRSTTTFEW